MEETRTKPMTEVTLALGVIPNLMCLGVRAFALLGG